MCSNNKRFVPFHVVNRILGANFANARRASIRLTQDSSHGPSFGHDIDFTIQKLALPILLQPFFHMERNRSIYFSQS